MALKIKAFFTTMAFVMVFFGLSAAYADTTDVIFIVEISEAMREADPDQEVLGAIAHFVGEMDMGTGVGVVGFSATTTTLPFQRLDTAAAIAAKRSAILGMGYSGENTDIAPALQTAANMLANAQNPIVFVITSGNRQTSYPSMHVPVHTIVINEAANAQGLPGTINSRFGTHRANFAPAQPDPTPSPSPTPTPEPTPTPSPDANLVPDSDFDLDLDIPDINFYPTFDPTLGDDIYAPPIHEWPEDYFENIEESLPDEPEEYEETPEEEEYEEQEEYEYPRYIVPILIIIAIITGIAAMICVLRYIKVVV